MYNLDTIGKIVMYKDQISDLIANGLKNVSIESILLPEIYHSLCRNIDLIDFMVKNNIRLSDNEIFNLVYLTKTPLKEKIDISYDNCFSDILFTINMSKVIDLKNINLEAFNSIMIDFFSFHHKDNYISYAAIEQLLHVNDQVLFKSLLNTSLDFSFSKNISTGDFIHFFKKMLETDPTLINKSDKLKYFFRGLDFDTLKNDPNLWAHRHIYFEDFDYRSLTLFIQWMLQNKSEDAIREFIFNEIFFILVDEPLKTLRPDLHTEINHIAKTFYTLNPDATPDDIYQFVKNQDRLKYLTVNDMEIL